ncbi:MAG: excinuclease ABC subunit UvrC [Sedimenticola sp.]
MSQEIPSQLFDHCSFLETLTTLPGVYRMVGSADEILYIGKARNLKRRVSSYFSRSLNRRIQNMVSQIRAIEITVTHTEAEALILENSLIKSFKPKYNILLRDDKSYPYIFLSAECFPRLTHHRGSRKAKGRYFGPYPNAGSMRETLQLMQKLFPVRQCEDTFYRNRSRPCLQYQIKRCTAPCVDLVSEAEYGLDVRDAELFLDGKTSRVIDNLVERMEQASAGLEFERAARYRDQVAALQQVQGKQVGAGKHGDIDIIAAVTDAGLACIQLFFIRNGRNLGNKVFFPQLTTEQEEKEVVSAFISQYYIGKTAPREIIVSALPDESDLLEEVLSQQGGRRVRLRNRVRSDRARRLTMALQNARLSLDARLASRAGMLQRVDALQAALKLDEPPGRMECFDVSHTAGELTVASCVVFDARGAVKSDYRRFNIEGIQGGDDYAAMEQALTRRYTRIQSGEGVLPDILFIDGGKGQLSAAAEVLQELAVSGVVLVGVAKGPDRKPGMEQLFLFGKSTPIILPANSPALHLIQQIRDEAHRFAITAHRQRRDKRRRKSPLEEIPGVGPKRRQRLLRQFGGLQGISRAGVEDLERIEGISRRLAQQIYESFHAEQVGG